jgi:hypothetical protein
MAAVVFLFAIPPMINMRVFVPWDLTFGSGMQTFGALLAVLTIVGDESGPRARCSECTCLAYLWIRYVIPGAILVVGAWWLSTAVLGSD